MNPIINGPGIFAMLDTELAIPNMLPCSVGEIFLDMNAGIDVLINPKPEASRELAKKKTITFWILDIKKVPKAIKIGPSVISF